MPFCSWPVDTGVSDVDMVRLASSAMGDSAVCNAVLQKALVGLVAVSLDYPALAHALSIATTMRLFSPGPFPFRSRFLQHLLCKGYGAHIKEHPCHE